MPKITNHADRLYGNWLMLAPDGTELCRCNEKKYRWYTSRGLAKQIEGGNTFQLNFWPKGLGHSGSSTSSYYLGEKKNVCVVCGTSEGLTKHHVVPTFYRKHFPTEIKGRSSHDLVLICEDDHYKYEIEASKLSLEIALETGVSVDAGIPHPIEGKHNWRLGGLINALYHYQNIPAPRIEEIKQTITKILGHEPSASELEELRLLRPPKAVKIIEKSHGYLVTKLLNDRGELPEFIRRWRRHFIKHAQPKHLPVGWSVDL